jgi:SAM-dependent methyltransferase
MNAGDIRKEVKKHRFWYHKINLGDGVITPGLDLDPLWDMIRQSRGYIQYEGKRVLDIASFDGMWAFEAEKLGASQVIATDCYYETFKNFLLCKEILHSEVIPYYNISPYKLCDRLDVFLQENWDDQKPYDRMFDVVQHLGLLYHLRDPLLTLSQARSVIKSSGSLLIETAIVINEDSPFMLFNGIPPDKQRIYDDITTWWAPTLSCLKEMLRASLFLPIDETIRILESDKLSQRIKNQIQHVFPGDRFVISRVSLVAKAVKPNDVDSAYFRELTRTYRNPGLVVENLMKVD